MKDDSNVPTATCKNPAAVLLWLIVAVLTLSCSEEESNAFSSYVDGYNHLRISSENLDLEYLFTHTEPNQNPLYPITDDSVFIHLKFYKDSISNIKVFEMKFHFDKTSKTVSEVNLFVEETYSMDNGDSASLLIGEIGPGPSGILRRFVPIILKVSNVHHSPENNQISFDYNADIDGTRNSTRKTLKLKGSLMAKHRPE